MDEQILEQFHDVRNHLYAVAAGSLGCWGTTKIEKVKNLIQSLFVRSHVWALQKRFPKNWTDLLTNSTQRIGICFTHTHTHTRACALTLALEDSY